MLSHRDAPKHRWPDRGLPGTVDACLHGCGLLRVYARRPAGGPGVRGLRMLFSRDGGRSFGRLAHAPKCEAR